MCGTGVELLIALVATAIHEGLAELELVVPLDMRLETSMCLVSLGCQCSTKGV